MGNAIEQADIHPVSFSQGIQELLNRMISYLAVLFPCIPFFSVFTIVRQSSG